jgi:arylsulfatase
VRSQFHHVIDVAPTVLEAAHLPEPKVVNGTAQTPIEGVSLAYTFDDPKAADRHTKQYFEIFGNRAIYHDGWLAGTVHRAPWEPKPRRALKEDVWELYDTRGLQLAADLARRTRRNGRHAGALHSQATSTRSCRSTMQRRRFNRRRGRQPDLMGPRTARRRHAGVENAFINVKNRSLTIAADVEVSGSGANGIILAQGGRFGGWALYVKDGKPTYHNLGVQRTTVAVPAARAEGDVDATSPRRRRPGQGHRTHAVTVDGWATDGSADDRYFSGDGQPTSAAAMRARSSTVSAKARRAVHRDDREGDRGGALAPDRVSTGTTEMAGRIP